MTRRFLENLSLRTLQIGSRSITFPNLFRAALEFALSADCFLVREIPGDLDAEAKVAVASRLMEEGQIIRRPDTPS